MSREYIIYSDESTQTGRYYTHFYGGALIRSEDLDYVREHLQSQANRLGLGAEIKWRKVSEGYLDRYKAMMDAFFDLVTCDLVKIRVMFTRVGSLPPPTPYHREHRYHLLYYQFFKHAFGLRHCNPDPGEMGLRLYVDRLPDSPQKNALFKSHLLTLQDCREFRAARIVIPQDQVAEVDSHEHLPLQCVDVVLGAMQFRLNQSHREQDEYGQRGKKTIAKEQLYEHICARIREIHPWFVAHQTTGRAGGKRDGWLHPYRHWCFEPRHRRVEEREGGDTKRFDPASAEPLRGAAQVGTSAFTDGRAESLEPM
jgi:hypothetical protein